MKLSNWSLQYCSLSLISFKPFSKWLVWLLPCCFARWFCIYDIGQWLWYGFNPVPRIISTKMVCVILIARLDGSACMKLSQRDSVLSPLRGVTWPCQNTPGISGICCKEALRDPGYSLESTSGSGIYWKKHFEIRDILEETLQDPGWPTDLMSLWNSEYNRDYKSSDDLG